MKSVLSEKGQVTIPKEVRDHLGLAPGQVIDFEARRGLLIGKKKVAHDGLDEVTGILRHKLSDVDAYLDDVRGPRRKKTLRR